MPPRPPNTVLAKFPNNFGKQFESQFSKNVFSKMQKAEKAKVSRQNKTCKPNLEFSEIPKHSENRLVSEEAADDHNSILQSF